MARARSVFICQGCGAAAARWAGQCQTCGAWNTLVETLQTAQGRAAPASSRRGPGSDRLVGRPTRLRDVDRRAGERRPTGIGEFDRVLGGGVVPGSTTLVGGDPGVGKSTLLLQALAGLAATAERVLYVTGEEAPHQVRHRAERLGYSDSGLELLAETDVDQVIATIADGGYAVAAIDSIQTMATADLESPPGSIGQLREATARLGRVARTTNTPVMLVGHVTKEGAIAGPKALEHMVDTVLYLEGERASAFRILRADKNRFGSTNEVGVFQMEGEGLVEVGNPSRVFLAERADRAVGSVVIATVEGTRPLLMEVQALTAPSPGGTPRRTANGIDYGRLMMLLAVLTRRGAFPLGSHDVYVNVVGGLAVREPAADLGIALAIASSFRDFAVPGDAVAIGEVGLSGEVRSVGQLERRLREAAQLGFKRALVPVRQMAVGRRGLGIEVHGVGMLGEALAWAKFGLS